MDAAEVWFGRVFGGPLSRIHYLLNWANAKFPETENET